MASEAAEVPVIVAAIPDDATLRRKIYGILETIDIETMGIKSFILLLSKEMNVSHDVLKATRRDFIKQTLTEAINEGSHNKEDDDDDDEEEEEEEEGEDTAEQDAVGENDGEDDDDEDDSKPSRSSSKGNGRGGLAQQKEISKALAEFFGKSNVNNGPTRMARTEVVKELWNYIRTNQLQNPDNKREILLDTAMQQVFGCTTFTMFTMNKYIGAHIEPFKPVDLTPKFKETSTIGTGKRLRGSSSRGSISTSSKSSSAVKKARKVGTQPPYLLSEALQDVVGTDILPRPQVVSKIWTYIKAHNLQNPSDKREILCDTKLKLLFDNKTKISMFKMNVYIGKHLVEKVDRSQYQHHDEEENDDQKREEDDDSDDDGEEE